MDDTKNTALKSFRRMGLALFAMAALTSGLQALLLLLPDYLYASSESFWKSGWYTWIKSFAPLYVIATKALLETMGSMLG